MPPTRTIYVLLFYFILIQFAHSQVCPQTNYEFVDQASIDNFASAHQGCSVITGNLTIWEASSGSIVNLQGLSGLEVIRGRLEIYDNTKLQTLEGLQYLDSIHQGVYLNWLHELRDVDALTQIPHIDHALSISSCSQLDSIKLFSQLTRLPQIHIHELPVKNLGFLAVLKHVGDLHIQNCDGLLELDGLQQLESAHEIQIAENEQLANLNGLGGLQSIDRMIISSNTALNSLEGMHVLDSLHEYLQIEDNPNLTSIQTLDPGYFNSLESISMFNNPLLSLCKNDFICAAIQLPGLSFNVYQNADGCNSFIEMAAGCSPGCPTNVFFRSQQDVDSYSTLFPGCHDVSGNVSVISRAATTIVSLDSLYILQSIGGHLEISHNPRLPHFLGLSHLEELGGDLLIINNDSIQSLTGLEGLKELHHVEITGNARLKDLQGLNHVTHADRMQLNQIERLTGLDSLQMVSGDFVVEGPALKSMTGPSQLERVSGGLKIQNADSLQTLAGLESLEHVGKLEIRNTGIQHVEGLAGLMQIDSHLILMQNDELISLGGMAPFIEIGGPIEISFNDSLMDLFPLQGLTHVQGDFRLLSNPMLPDMDEVIQLEEIKGTCAISGNHRLQNLTGLAQLKTVGGSLIINNLNQESCAGVENLRFVGGDLDIRSNGKLVDLSSFIRLDSVLGTLTILGTGLDTMDGFDKLQYVGGTLEIRGNRTLLVIPGLDSLQRVGGIRIEDNTGLQHMDGLSSLSEVNGTLWMNGNYRLSHLPDWGQLRHIEGDLIIERSADLTSLAGLDSLIDIQGELILYSLGLDSLNGLGSLESCKGGLTLRNLNRLEDVDPLQSLHSIQGPLRILQNSQLANIHGLRHLDPGQIVAAPGEAEVTITDNLNLGNCSIEPLCALLEDPGRTYVVENNNAGCESAFDIQTQCPLSYGCLPTGITFGRQSQIDSFKIMYPGCTFLQGDVTIREELSGDITHLDSLYGIEILGGNLRIEENTHLVSLSGLDQVTRIGGGVRISKNDRLTNIDGLNQVDPFFLTSTRLFAHDLWLTQNIMLNHCASDLVCGIFTNPEAVYLIQGNAPACSHPDSVSQRCNYPGQCVLDTITHQSLIDEFPIRNPGCTELMSDLILMPTDESLVYVSHLDGLEQLTSIRGSIEIYNADALLNLNGLDQVTEIDGRILLFGNNKLETLEGIRHIDPASVKSVQGQTLVIQHNPLISECSLENICQLLQVHEATSVIGNNNTGCDDINEVLSSCIVNVPVVEAYRHVQIYPNPTNGDFIVVLPEGVNDVLGSMRLFNSMGVQVRALDYHMPVRLEGLPQGVYTLMIQSGDLDVYLARILFLPYR